MRDLSVEVDNQDIVVTNPSSGLSVTYRREGRVLVALEPIRNDPHGEELNFPLRRLSRLAGPTDQKGEIGVQ